MHRPRLLLELHGRDGQRARRARSCLEVLREAGYVASDLERGKPLTADLDRCGKYLACDPRPPGQDPRRS